MPHRDILADNRYHPTGGTFLKPCPDFSLALPQLQLSHRYHYDYCLEIAGPEATIMAQRNHWVFRVYPVPPSLRELALNSRLCRNVSSTSVIHSDIRTQMVLVAGRLTTPSPESCIRSCAACRDSMSLCSLIDVALMFVNSRNANSDTMLSVQ